MLRRLGIWGASEESLRLLRLLSGNPEVEVTRIFDVDVAASLERARGLGTECAAGLWVVDETLKLSEILTNLPPKSRSQSQEVDLGCTVSSSRWWPGV